MAREGYLAEEDLLRLQRGQPNLSRGGCMVWHEREFGGEVVGRFDGEIGCWPDDQIVAAEIEMSVFGEEGLDVLADDVCAGELVEAQEGGRELAGLWFGQLGGPAGLFDPRDDPRGALFERQNKGSAE